MIDRRQPNRIAPKWRQVLDPIWHLSDDQREMAWPLAPTAWWLCWWRGLLMVPGVRWLCWFIRNPACNFFSVIIGIAHRSRTVYVAKGDGWTYTNGLNYGWIKADESNLKLPFFSYRGKYIELMLGWKTSGGFAAFPFRRANSKGPNAH